MKKRVSPKAAAKDEMRSEYDLSDGARNPYARQLRESGYTIRVHHPDGAVTEKCFPGENTVTLAPDVQEYFPTSEAVNQALRTLISILPEQRKMTAKKAAGARRSPRKTLKT